MVFSANVPRRRRTGLVVPPPTMATDQEQDPTSGDGGSSSADISVASPSSSVPSANNGEAVAAAAQLKSEEERLRKGKMLAVDQTPKNGDALLQPPVEKLMGDAIRAGVDESHDACMLTAVKDIVFDDIPIVSDTLRGILLDLGPVSPICVYEKKMSYSDRENGQNRLLMSYKSKRKSTKHSDSHRRRQVILSDKELAIVYEQEDKAEGKENNKTEEQKQNRKEKRKRKKEAANSRTKKQIGLDVQAYDRNGEMYHLKYRYLVSNTGYRIKGEDWKEFLKKNNLLVKKMGEKTRKYKKLSSPESDGSEGQSKSSSPSPEPNGCGRKKQEIDNVRIELWVFRSPKLKVGCTDHTEGAMGMVMLHYHEDEDGADEHADDVGPASTEEEPCGSEDFMESDGPDDQQGEAVPDGEEPAQEMVMAGPDEVPKDVALPVVLVDAADHHGEAADMDGATTSSTALDALEGLLLLGGNIERGEGLKLTAMEAFSLLQLN